MQHERGTQQRVTFRQALFEIDDGADGLVLLSGGHGRTGLGNEAGGDGQSQS